MKQYYTGLLCDEVAEVICELQPDEVMAFEKLSFSIPRSAARSGSVQAWRNNVNNGLRGSMDVYGNASAYCDGSIPVKTVCNLLAHESFQVDKKSNHWNNYLQTVCSVEEFAHMLDTTPAELPKGVTESVDYNTTIAWTDKAVTLTTIEHESGKWESKVLRFPFTNDDYSDAIVGLQCWADAAYWDAIHAEED